MKQLEDALRAAAEWYEPGLRDLYQPAPGALTFDGRATTDHHSHPYSLRKACIGLAVMSQWHHRFGQPEGHPDDFRYRPVIARFIELHHILARGQSVRDWNNLAGRATVDARAHASQLAELCALGDDLVLAARTLCRSALAVPPTMYQAQKDEHGWKLVVFLRTPFLPPTLEGIRIEGSAQ